MAKLTGTELIDDLRATVRNIDNFGTQSQLRALNKLNTEWHEIIKQQNPYSLITSTTINVVSNTNIYTLPTDFIDLLGPFTGVFEADDTGVITNNQLPSTSAGDNRDGYFLSGDSGSISLNVTPKDPRAKTLIVQYIPELTRRTDVDDSLVLDQRFLELGVNGILKEYYRFMQMRAEKLEAEEDYVNTLDDFIVKSSRVPDSGGLPDISAAFGSVNTTTGNTLGF